MVDLHEQDAAVAQLHLHWLIRSASMLRQQIIEPGIGDVAQLTGTDLVICHAQHREPGAVCTNDPAIVGDRNDPFGHGSDPFGVPVDVQAYIPAKGRDHQPVFDQPHRRGDQAECLRISVAMIAGDIEDSHKVALV